MPIKPSPTPELITVTEAAGILGVSEKTVWRYLKDGGLRRWTHWKRTALSRPEVEKVARERTQKEANK
jgi:excisionase family DNA binding protein